MFAAMLRDINVNGRTVHGAPSMSADDAEEIGYAFDDDDDDETPRDDETETDPDADLKDLTETELFNRVFYEPGIPLLENLVDMARGWQLGSPFGVLGKALGTAACDVPGVSFVSGTGSSRVPLNFLLGMVGKPGMGKGATMGAPIYPRSHLADEPLIMTTVKVIEFSTEDGGTVKVGMTDERSGCGNPYGLPQIVYTTPASGQMFIAKFFRQVTVIDPKTNKEITVTEQHTDPVWAEWNEVDQLTAKSGVKGATLDPCIRSVHTGERVGDEALNRAKDGVGMIVEAGTYRCIIVVGVQPERAAAIIKSGDGGTLQRYIMLSLADSEAPHPDELLLIRRRLHKRLGLPMPEGWSTLPPRLIVHGPSEVEVSDEVTRLLMLGRRAVLRQDGTVSDEDTHAFNNRLRIAAIYAGWKLPPGEKVVIDREAWMWAGAVMEHSRRHRENIKAILNSVQTREAVERGRLMGVSKEAAEAHQEQLEAVKAQELALKLVAKLTVRPKQSLRDLKNNVSHKQRTLLDQALIIAEENGQIIYEDGAWFAVVDGQVKR
ncbi:hypothetical protein O984_24380 [Mycobacterium avium 05-4293]|nr:hypothetical protein O984_24380 [Mycobacterium avium 05-4293]